MKFQITRAGATFDSGLRGAASAAVITAGDPVTQDANGAIIAGTAAGTDVSYALTSSAAGETDNIGVTNGNDFELLGTADRVLAATDLGQPVDLNADGTIDLDGSTTGVFQVANNVANKAAIGTTSVRVVIAKPTFK